MKNYIKKNKRIHYFLLCIIRFIPQRIKFEFYRFIRVNNIINEKKYSKLKNYKNKHLGEKCFIVATGPSLTIEDLEKIKNQTTFSMNSIVLSLESTEYRPTYYGIQDLRAYYVLKDSIEKSNINTIFSGIHLSGLKKEYIEYPLNLLNHNGIFFKHYTKFSDDIYSVVYDGFTITYSLMQIAVYMGFKEIYLLGVDCNYKENGDNHIKNYITQTNPDAAYLMRESYKIAKEYADLNGIKIYNASRGGNLDIFERIDLDNLGFIRENLYNENID